MIEHAPEEERANLLRACLEDRDWLVRVTALKTIKHIPEEERSEIIRTGMEDKTVHVRRAAANMIEYAPEMERADLIRISLEDEDALVRKTAASVIKYAPEEERGDLRERVSPPPELETTDLERLAQETPLYNKAPETFGRADFEKGGSRTTLLDKVPGGSEKTLKGKVIIRHIPFPALKTWSDAFEASNFWKEKGFDYVPIEPIVGMRTDPKEATSVAVFSRVLGPSVAMWKEKSTLFLEQIEASMRRIIKALEEQGVEHGHTHEGNFCLVFHKKEDGKTPDLTKPPRVYAIDFDMAASSPPE
jgi:hypothetical protein